MNEILENKKAVTDCTWADTCMTAQTTPLIRKNFKNEFEYCVPNADKNSKIFNIKDRQLDINTLYDKYPETKKLYVYYPQLTQTFKEQLDEAQEERFRRLIGRKIKIVDLEQEPENSPYFGKVGEIQDVQVDPYGDVVLYGTWGGIGIYPKYDSFVYVNEEEINEENEIVEKINLNEAYEDWKLEAWIAGNPRNMNRMSSQTMHEYAGAAAAKANWAIRDEDWDRARRCINILQAIKDQAEVKGFNYEDWYSTLQMNIGDLNHNLIAGMRSQERQQDLQQDLRARADQFWESIKTWLEQHNIEYDESHPTYVGNHAVNNVRSTIWVQNPQNPDNFVITFVVDSQNNFYYHTGNNHFDQYRPANGFDVNQLMSYSYIITEIMRDDDDPEERQRFTGNDNWDRIKTWLDQRSLGYAEVSEYPDFGDPDLADIERILSIEGEDTFALDADGQIHYFTPEGELLDYNPRGQFNVDELMDISGVHHRWFNNRHNTQDRNNNQDQQQGRSMFDRAAASTRNR